MIYITGGQFTGKLATLLDKVNGPNGFMYQAQIKRKGLGLIVCLKLNQFMVLPNWKVK